jgi:glycosyltransferase involved in cell wall biosynthesis
MSSEVELTILMPCLNEAETISRCIQKAFLSLRELGLKGEVLIADNGSTDGSKKIAHDLGARVVAIAEKGYGNALRGGIEAARGKYIIMGDADDSYDFSRLGPFVEKLRAGGDLVMGCRMPRGGGTVLPGAMPWKHYWIGNPALSFIGRLFFKCPAQDFHCGLRGFSKAAYQRMGLNTTGMEFASEMVIKATLNGLRISEVPITLHKDGRSRPPHLRSWRDGWRHLRFMLLFSPRWLFLYPGVALMLVGLLAVLALTTGNRLIFGMDLDVGTMAVACAAFVIGFQLVMFGVFTKAYAIANGFLPKDLRFARFEEWFSLERGVLIGLLFLLLGLGGLGYAAWQWKRAGFGDIAYEINLRRIATSSANLIFGVQIIFSSFFLSVLHLPVIRRAPAA